MLGGFFLLVPSYLLLDWNGQSNPIMQENENPIVMEKDAPQVTGEAPKLLFSDLSHGPKNGWSKSEPKKGAAISIWGRGFGDSRNNSYVKVNGLALKKDTDYAEWNADSYDVFFLKRITFWLRDECKDGAGTISVTVNGKESKEIPFTVIRGNIYFVNKDANAPGSGALDKPWASPNMAVKSLKPGDVLYFRETQTPYGEKYFTGRHNFYLKGSNTTDGQANAPIALASFPGEVATIDTIESGKKRVCDTAFHIGRNYWTISKFRLRAIVQCLGLGNTDGSFGYGIRAVGNDCVGCQQFGGGTAPISTRASNIKVYGNSSHGGRTNTKFDHGIYVSCNPSDRKGVDIGWNYIYDNQYASGPLIVINHQGDRIPPNKSCKRHDVHHNLIDCGTNGGRGIGIYSMSWDQKPGELEPERAYIYNNILLGATGSAMYCLNGKASFLNNTLVNCENHAMTVGGEDVLSVVVKNNIFHMSKGSKYFYVVSGSKELIFDNNLYYGLGSGPAEDVHAINGAPSLNRYLIPTQIGPEVDQGQPTSEVADDFWGTARPSGKAFDIGACEFQPETAKK